MRLPPRYTPPDTLFPYTTLSRYHGASNRREKAGNRGNKRLALSHVPSSLPVRRLADCPVRGGGRARRGRPHHRQAKGARPRRARRSEEHTSELQSLMRISYAVFCLKKKKSRNSPHKTTLISRLLSDTKKHKEQINISH